MTAVAANDTRMKTLMNEVREFGRLAAQGRDSLPMLAIKVAYAAADNVISLVKDADGSDDYSKLYAEYLAADSKKAVHEHTTGGLKANVSKLRQIGTAAAMPTCDFYASVNKIILKREELLAAKAKVRACYPAIVEAARKQTAQADDLTDAQIVEAINKPAPSDKTVEGELKRVLSTLDGLISGECGVMCQDQEVLDAQVLISTKLAAFTQMKDVKDTLAKAQALGLTIVEVTPEGNALAA